MRSHGLRRTAPTGIAREPADTRGGRRVADGRNHWLGSREGFASSRPQEVRSMRHPAATRARRPSARIRRLARRRTGPSQGRPRPRPRGFAASRPRGFDVSRRRTFAICSSWTVAQTTSDAGFSPRLRSNVQNVRLTGAPGSTAHRAAMRAPGSGLQCAHRAAVRDARSGGRRRAPAVAVRRL